MQLDNIPVFRKLWGMFLLLMLAMLVVAGFQQYRANSSMAQAMHDVMDIESRITQSVRWRGDSETTVSMLMGAAVTSDAVLAQQYDAKVKELNTAIGKIQEAIVARTSAPGEKAVLDQVLVQHRAVQAATAKTWDLKGEGDVVETQRFADEQLAPQVARFLQAQDAFVATLEKSRETVVATAGERRMRYMAEGLVVAALLMALFLFMAWRLVRSITTPLQRLASRNQPRP